MKNIKIYLIIIVLAISFDALSQQKFVAGANAGVLLPMSTLGNRFKPTMEYSAFFGQETSPTWTWTGNFEYFKFTKQNDNKLKMSKKLKEINYIYTIPNGLMTLEVAGLTANAKFKVYEDPVLCVNLNFGFGVYNWTYKRSAYNDSLYTPDSSHALVAAIKLANNTQTDWSGGFNLGLGAEVKVYDPVYFNISGCYKAVIGELWPALEIDLENVSVFQMFEIKAGVTVKF